MSNITIIKMRRTGWGKDVRKSVYALDNGVVVIDPYCVNMKSISEADLIIRDISDELKQIVYNLEKGLSVEEQIIWLRNIIESVKGVVLVAQSLNGKEI